MAYSISKKEIIDYPPSTLHEFEVFAFEYIDNLNFTLKPEDCISNAQDYIAIAKARFLEEGWEGDGDIELMWIPPFMLNDDDESRMWTKTKGVTVWHVKQDNDGTSWILYPKILKPDLVANNIVRG